MDKPNFNMLTLSMFGNFACFMSSADFSKKKKKFKKFFQEHCTARVLIFSKLFFFQKIVSGTLLECKTVWMQITPDIMSGLI